MSEVWDTVEDVTDLVSKQKEVVMVLGQGTFLFFNRFLLNDFILIEKILICSKKILTNTPKKGNNKIRILNQDCHSGTGAVKAHLEDCYVEGLVACMMDSCKDGNANPALEACTKKASICVARSREEVTEAEPVKAA